jgi:hypothetical protein
VNNILGDDLKSPHKQIFVAAALAGVLSFSVAVALAQQVLDRTVLPIAEPKPSTDL